MEKYPEYLKGRGAQFNPGNKFQKLQYDNSDPEGLDEATTPEKYTQVFLEYPKKVINKIESPDIGMAYSINPYQGCEHGCIYCYARNTHAYWGFSAGVDFEQKIIVKQNVPELLKKEFEKKSYQPLPIMVSGNTDCYQPLEKKFQLTRSILEVALEYRNPIGIITKNSLVLKDLDLLKELNALDLVHISLSITTLDESLRRLLEPRTASVHKRLEAVKELSFHHIPVNVMIAPIIPGLTNHEIPELIKAISERGASSVAYTMVRLNGEVAGLFEQWIHSNFPDRADKVLNQIKDVHGGSLSDSRFGVRMRGEGKIAESIRQLFKLSKNKYMKGRKMRPFNLSSFRRPDSGQLSLF